MTAWLIVAGPSAGQIWHDEPGIGWWPWLDAKDKPMSFLGWYLSWLTLATRGRNLRVPPKPWE
jgi:hypothetical protein